MPSKEQPVRVQPWDPMVRARTAGGVAREGRPSGLAIEHYRQLYESLGAQDARGAWSGVGTPDFFAIVFVLLTG